MNHRTLLLLSALLLSLVQVWGRPVKKLPQHLFGSVNRKVMEAWADSIYRQLSLEDRVAQLIMPIVYPSAGPEQISKELRRVRSMRWGGILYQKGLMADQLIMNDSLQRASRIPLLIALDGEWGLQMRLKDAPRYPRNMGLGINADNQLLYNYGREVARQCRLMGIHINFAPDVDVNINPRNPVIGTRSYGEDPQLVAERALAYAAGLEDGGILSVAKHFPGHGDTSEDSHHTLPLVSASKERMQRVELYPFAQYIKSGHGGIMTAHLRVPAYEPDHLPSSLSPRITGDLLREEMKFHGLVFTDGLEMKGALGGRIKAVGVQALLAGNDILLGPINPEGMHREIVDAVRGGRLSEAIIKDRVMRVLYYKWRLIVHEPSRTAKPEHIRREIWTPMAEQQMRQAWRSSLTFVREDADVQLDLKNKQYKRIAVVEVGKNPIKMTNRPTSTGRVDSRIDYFTWESVRQSPNHLDSYGLVLLQIFQLPKQSEQLLGQICVKKAIIVACMTSPYKVDLSARWLSNANVIVLAYEAAREAQEAVLGLLSPLAESPEVVLPESTERLTEPDPTSTLLTPVATTTEKPREPRMAAPFVAKRGFKQINPVRLIALDQLAQEGITRGAYPGCQIYVAHRGKVMYNKAFGTVTGGVGSPAVTTGHLYDIASITKALAMTPVVMSLIGEGKLTLDGSVGLYMPELAKLPIGEILIRDLLLHQSGLPAGLHFFRDLIDPTSYEGSLIRYTVFPGGVPLVGKAWGNPYFSWDPEYISTSQTKKHTRQFAQGLWLNPLFKERMMSRLRELTPRKTKQTIYSDLNFVLLQQIAERVSGEPLDEYFYSHITKPIGAKAYYTPLERGVSQDSIVPAQRDDFLRKQIIQGTVDDETAACLGGVSGNAGLFASASELGKLCELILNVGVWQDKIIIPSPIVECFITTTNSRGQRALGFDKPRKRGFNPAAGSASSSTIGHQGFTGTAFWIDPQQELIFVFLSNRTYPSRHNKQLITDLYRPRMHQILYDAME